MYTLYYSQGTCSMAVHALLHELGVDFKAVAKKTVENYDSINSLGGVPVLDDDGLIIREGAAIILYLLEKHNSPMLPQDRIARSNAMQWMMLANASLHPAYGLLFFAKRTIKDKEQREEIFQKGKARVEKLWKDIDTQLGKTLYVCGPEPGAADFLLAVYANWNAAFTFDIEIGGNTKRMVKDLSQRPSFQKALEAEGVPYRAAA